MKKVLSILLRNTVIILLCTYLILMGWFNRGVAKTQLKKLYSGEVSYSELPDKIAAGLVANVRGKTAFINLNGLYRKSIGQITDNGIVRLKNGMLTAENIDEMDMELRAASVTELKEWLEKEKIPFLYVQAPFKVDLEKKLLPDGITNFANENADQMLNLLEKNNVKTLDLRPFTCQTAALVENHFYATDHHWNPLGAFVGYQKITEYIQQSFPGTQINREYLDLDNWTVHKKDNWFLGSRGKRVGTKFGPVDNLIWITPDFDTEISCAIPYSNRFYKGNFTEANIRPEWYEKETADYFNDNPYCVYIGGDYPIVQHRNAAAPSDLKLLLIKDSFTLPMQSFLSAEFQEVDVIDLRHYKAGTFADYLEDSNPDMVIMMIFPGSFGTDKEFEYGISLKRPYRKLVTKKQPISPEIIVDPESERYDYHVIQKDLKEDTAYRMEIDQINSLKGSRECVMFALYDKVSKKVIQQKLFDIEYCNQNGGYSWQFITPDEGNVEYQLVVYPELPGSTQEDSDMEKDEWSFKISELKLYEEQQ